ncbi:SRPBCC domain-containing protein [Planctomycetota bacterium]|nr:SRPBCC domain-containing protein [Planctomycetota bacterium]
MSTTSNQDLTLKLQRTINASADELFDAWLNPDTLAAWFKPEPVLDCDDCQINPTETGIFRITLLNRDTGEHYIVTGHFIDLDEPNTLSFTWSWELPQNGIRDTICTVLFDPITTDPDQTVLTFIHTGFPDQDACDDHEQGWKGCLDSLAEHFSS